MSKRNQIKLKSNSVEAVVSKHLESGLNGFFKDFRNIFFCIFIVLKFGMNTFTNVLEHVPERHKLILLHFSKLGQNNKKIRMLVCMK